MNTELHTQIENANRRFQLFLAFAAKYGDELPNGNFASAPGAAHIWFYGENSRAKAIELFGADGWCLTGSKATKIVDGVTVEVDAITTAQTVTLAA